MGKNQKDIEATESLQDLRDEKHSRVKKNNTSKVAAYAMINGDARDKAIQACLDEDNAISQMAEEKIKPAREAEKAARRA